MVLLSDPPPAEHVHPRGRRVCGMILKPHWPFAGLLQVMYQVRCSAAKKKYLYGGGGSFGLITYFSFTDTDPRRPLGAHLYFHWKKKATQKQNQRVPPSEPVDGHRRLPLLQLFSVAVRAVVASLGVSVVGAAGRPTSARLQAAQATGASQ